MHDDDASYVHEVYAVYEETLRRLRPRLRPRLLLVYGDGGLCAGNRCVLRVAVENGRHVYLEEVEDVRHAFQGGPRALVKDAHPRWGRHQEGDRHALAGGDGQDRLEVDRHVEDHARVGLHSDRCLL